jgi:recombination protein RecA
LKKGSEGEYGIRAKVKVAKNKVAPPFRIAEFDIIFGHGISQLGCLVDIAEQTDVINRKGAWYSYNGDNIAQGRDNTIKYLEENPEKVTEIEAAVHEKIEMGALVPGNSSSTKKSKKSTNSAEEDSDSQTEEE